MHELSLAREAYPPGQPAVLLVVSSETDSATGKAFPFGRSVSTVFQRTRDPAQREALTTSLGNYGPYRTHMAEKLPAPAARGGRAQLLPDVVELGQGEARGARDCMCPYIDTQILSDRDIRQYAAIRAAARNAAGKPPGEREDYAGVRLRRVNGNIPPYLPFLVAGAGNDIVTQHNGIYNQLFIDFIRAFMLEMDARAGDSKP
jgi:hypothetical protein